MHKMINERRVSMVGMVMVPIGCLLCFVGSLDLTVSIGSHTWAGKVYPWVVVAGAALGILGLWLMSTPLRRQLRDEINRGRTDNG